MSQVPAGAISAGDTAWVLGSALGGSALAQSVIVSTHAEEDPERRQPAAKH